MKMPIYAALDLHSRHSVLGSMEHGGKTGARMRFATEAETLRAQVARLRKAKRPLFLTMEAGALTRWDWQAVVLRSEARGHLTCREEKR